MRSEKSKYTFIGRLLMQHRGKGLKLIRLNASWKQDLKWILHSWCNNLTFWEIHVLSNTCQDWHHSALNDDGVMAATSSGDTLTDNIFLNRLESESESFETFVPSISFKDYKITDYIWFNSEKPECQWHHSSSGLLSITVHRLLWCVKYKEKVIGLLSLAGRIAQSGQSNATQIENTKRDLDLE